LRRIIAWLRVRGGSLEILCCQSPRQARATFKFLSAVDFSRLETLEQLAAIVKRDFEEQSPTGTDLLRRIEARAYQSRYDLLRDLGLHLFWVTRFSITMRPELNRRPPRSGGGFLAVADGVQCGFGVA
jgi:hypothetical protein